jgi:hypothetical protein
LLGFLTSRRVVVVRWSSVLCNADEGCSGGGGQGGGVFFTRANAQITGGSVSQNQAQTILGAAGGGQGGGIFLNGDGSILSVSGKALISGNTAESATDRGYGGGIFLSSFLGGRDTLDLSDSTVSANTAQGAFLAGGQGGGIYSNGGIIHLSNATIGDRSSSAGGNKAEGGVSGGSGMGGGIFVAELPPGPSGGQDLFTMDQTTVSHNLAGGASGGSEGGEGGGIAMIVVQGAAITNSTIDHNTAQKTSSGGGGDGGGIYTGDVHLGTTLSVTNSTIAFNTAENGSGGGMLVLAQDHISLLNDTIAYNQASSSGGGGITREPGQAPEGTGVSVENTIIANNTAQSTGAQPIVTETDVLGLFNSLGHNIVGFASGQSGFTDGSNGDQVGSDPHNPLNPGLASTLKNNGGPTNTIALLPDSIAINHADSNAPPTDQRGHPRGTKPDVGAFELGQAPLPPPPPPTPPAPSGPTIGDQ